MCERDDPMFIHYNVVGLTNKNVILQLSFKPHFLEERSRAETESGINSDANEATPCRLKKTPHKQHVESKS